MIAQFALLTALVGGVGLTPVGWLAGAAYAVVSWVVLSTALHRSGAAELGPANMVTLTRASLVAAVTALVADAAVGRLVLADAVPGTLPFILLITLASVALLLDAVDGLVARRTGTSSALGARFDMEIDAFLILVLSVFVALSLGGWVLLIGGFRYVFVAASGWLPWLSAPLPPQLWRKAVAALQGLVLVVAGTGLLGTPAAAVLVGAALVALCWSFGRDIHWLWSRSATTSARR